MFNSNYPTNLKLLTLTSTTINGSNLNIDTSVNFRNALLYLNSPNKIGILNAVPQYTLDIAGDINLTGNIYKDGQMILTEFADVSLWSTLPGYIFYNGGSVGIGTTSDPTPYLFYVNGTSYFASNVTLNGNLNSNSIITCNDIVVSDTATINNLDVSGITNLNGLTSSNPIDTNGLVVSSGNINVSSGDIIAPGSTITCLNCYVTNQSTFASNVTFEENVSVIGKLNCVDNFNVNNKLTIYGPSGNIVTSGSATIANSVSIGSSLEVGGYSEFYKATINNDLNINGNLYVNTGSTNLHDLTVTDGTNLNGNVSIDSGNVLFNSSSSTTTPNVIIKYPTVSTSSTSGALVVTGGVGIGKNLITGGSITSLSGTSNFIDINVIDDLTVNGYTVLNSDTKVYANTDIYGDLNVELPGGTINALNLNIGNLSSPLVPSLSIDSDGNLNTTGNIELNQNLTVGGDVLIEGNLTLSGSTSSFAGGIITNSRFIQDTLATYDIYTTYSGSTFIIISHDILDTINLPSTNTTGTYYKFIIGPGYTNSSTIDIQINSSSPNITMFGLIDNASTYTSVSSASVLTLNSNVAGDFVEISLVSTSSTGDYAYYINAKSSNSNGFLYS